MRGFTLVEGLVAVLITFIVAVGIAGLLTFFGIYNRQNILQTCLVQAASSAIEACRGGNAVGNIQCNRFNVSISVSGSCNPRINSCSTVTATASAEGRSFSLTDIVCRFD
ncbi:MAG: hypothetical protein WHS43_07485 [Aquificaceae bacterium]|uniref:type IV pilus modification PilV family protein n=1 Tax=Hydrogenobacter sp. Uz 6-8 TaxID=3384828 RepID=UPI0030B765C9